MPTRAYPHPLPDATTGRARRAPMRVVVCLPSSTPVDDLTTTALTRLRAATAAVQAHPSPHFLIGTRWRRRRLLDAHGYTAAGGPIELLDLTAMRLRARDIAWHHWQVWHEVVTGTRPAQPWWVFASRHSAALARHTLDDAHRLYLAQPRIAAMRTYNLLPTTRTPLPLSDLEAFQAGEHTYAHLGYLTAVPGTALITGTGSLLTPASDHLADHLTYLDTAQTHLHTLTGRDHLLALVTDYPVAASSAAGARPQPNRQSNPGYPGGHPPIHEQAPPDHQGRLPLRLVTPDTHPHAMTSPATDTTRDGC